LVYEPAIIKEAMTRIKNFLGEYKWIILNIEELKTQSSLFRGGKES